MSSIIDHDAIALAPEGTHAETTGRMVWWDLEGEIALSALALAWAEAGLEDKDRPSAPTAGVRLRRALKRQTAGRRSAQKLVRRVKDGSLALVAEEIHRDQAEDPLEYATELVAELTAEEKVQFTKGQGSELARAVAEQYELEQGYVSSDDVGNWLAELLVAKVGAVSCRQHGSIYFVPPAGVAMLDKVLAVLRKVSRHKVYTPKAFITDESVVESVLTGVRREVESTMSAIDEEASEGLSDKKVEHRKAILTKLEARLSNFELLLGQAMPDLHVSLENLQARLVFAALEAG